MPRRLHALATTLAKHWKRSALAAVLAFVVIAALGAAAGGSFQNDFTIPGAESQKAVDVLESRFPAAAGDTAWGSACPTTRRRRPARRSASPYWTVAKAMRPSFDSCPGAAGSSGFVAALTCGCASIASRAPRDGLRAAAVAQRAVVDAEHDRDGAVTAVFNDGFGMGLIGLDETIPTVSFVPLMMFAILFGLSMDYNVFLLSRIREAYHEGDSPKASVLHGMSRIAKVILVAGAIMASVFAGLMLTPDAIIKQMGFGLAVAILIDVLVVRMLVAPRS